MSQLLFAAKEVSEWLDAQGIGGLAVQRWGEPRLTHGVDFTVLAELGCEAYPWDR